MENLFNTNFSKKLRAFFLVIGSLILAIAFHFIKVFSSTYVFDLMSFDFYVTSIIIAFSTMGVLLGIVLLIINFNYKNKILRCFVFMLVGAIVVLFFYNLAVRAIVISLVLLFLILFIISLIFRVYCTLTTMSFLFCVYVLLLLGIVKLIVCFFPSITVSPNILIYLTVTSFLVIYQILAVWINRQFILRVMIKPEKLETYTSEVMRSHISLIYVTGFIAVNATGLIYLESDYNFYNVVNNCFITAIALSQIKWNHIKF